MDAKNIGQAVTLKEGPKAIEKGQKLAEKYVGQLAGEKFGQLAGKAVGALGGKALNALVGFLFGRTDPNIPFSFYVEIGGIRCVKFTEARGLNWKAEPVTFREGGNNRHAVNLIGPGSFTPLEIKKGFFAASDEFFQWMNNTLSWGHAPVERVNLSVVVNNDAGEEVARFNLYGAWVSEYKGPEFNATSSGQLAFESVTIQYDWFEFVPGGKLAGLLQQGLAKIGL